MNKYLLLIASLLSLNNVAATSCQHIKTECIEAGGTRYFNGVPVTLDCWRYRTIYECKEACDNNCQTLRDQGCALVKTECRNRADGICAIQDSVFSCPVEKCTENGPVICGKKPFCADGSCTTTIPKINNNFDKTTAMLAALNDAGKQLLDKQTNNPDERFIFAGKSSECSRGALHTKDCCGNGRGWAQGIFGCDNDEKDLAVKHEDGLTIKVGEYCHNRDPVINSCLSRHKVYCVFDSKIARIVQYYGRYKQLGRSFGRVDGDNSNPDCTGISINELIQMDFSKMDFSAIYAEIMKSVNTKLPVNGSLKTKVTSQSSDAINKKMQQQVPEVTANDRIKERAGDFYDRVK